MNNCERRTDNELRCAINRIRACVDEHRSEDSIYQNTLIELCALTDSPIGFIFGPTNDHTGNDAPKSVFWSNSNLEVEKSTINQIGEELRFCITFSTSKVLSELNLQPINKLNSNLPKLQQMLIMPLHIRGTTFAKVCLANSSNRYHIDYSKRCWPLMTTSACLFRATQNFSGDSDLPSPQLYSNPNEMIERLTPVGMICVDKSHRIVRMNPAAKMIFGVNENNAIGEKISKFIPERFPNEHRNHIFVERPLTNNTDLKIFLNGLNASGETFPLELNHFPFYENGEKLYMLLVGDNTELQEIRAQQEAQMQKFKAVADLAPMGILQTDVNWQAVYVNDRWCEICGFSESEVLSHGWINALYHEDVSQNLEELRESIVHTREFNKECRIQTPVGDILWVEIHARPMFNPQGEVDGFIATLTDCTYRHITEHKLRMMAERDSLTGLANRALFQDRLEHALSRIERHGALALLCLDLDGFKNINDTLGHDAGDKLLIEIANRLKSCVRQEDTIARVGGDEFMIVLEGLQNANIAAAISEKILSKLEPPTIVSGQEVFASTSIGITFATRDQPVDSKNLIKQADIALYRAKAEGRNNFQYYSPELEVASKDRLYLGNCLHRALERQEFRVHYQLQADVASGAIVGAEALLRWQHPERGLLPPNDFIPLLEESGLIASVSRWVWKEAFNDYMSWRKKGLMKESSHISINLSARELRDPNLVKYFCITMKSSGISGHNIIAEITESALIENTSHTLECLKTLREHGIKISLDDFGTGYSSLTYLKRFPIDNIKIDQTFIRDILTDTEDCAITKAVIALAESLNIDVVAEGVDAESKLNKLRALGCPNYQGYQLNKPCTSAEIENLLYCKNPQLSLVPIVSKLSARKNE